MANVTRRSLMVAAATGMVGGSAALAAGGTTHAFELRGDGVWDDLRNAFNPSVGANVVGVAHVSGIGRVAQAGNLFLSPPDANGIAPGHGSVVLTTTHGEQIHFDYSGLLDTHGGTGLAVVKFTGGTGRYANAHGIGSLFSEIDVHNLVNARMKVVRIDGQLLT